MASPLVIVKQTVVHGTGWRTRYSNVPTYEDLAQLERLGYAATLVNTAPRGGAHGKSLRVPEKQAEKARRALKGELVYATQAAERAARAAERLHKAIIKEVAANIINKNVRRTYSDVGSLKVAVDVAEEFVPLSERVRSHRDGYLIPNGRGDGAMEVAVIQVRDPALRFSRHEAYGNEAPRLVAEAQGTLRVFEYDCGDEWFVVNARARVNIYAGSRGVYIVGTDVELT